jgi:transposase
VEDWAEIRRLHGAEGLPIKAIARLIGVSRNTVRTAIASDAAPKYERKRAGSIVDAVEPKIREQLQLDGRMPATVIAERIGWTRGITVLKERVADLRPAYLPPDPASRTSYEAGDIAQCDLWFPPIQLPVGFGQIRRPARLPVLTMVTGYSRWLSGQLIPTRAAPDLFAGWWQIIERLGAVPRTLVWDGEGAVGRWRQGKTELTQECQAFRGTLGAKVIVLKPREPEHKGIIERAHNYLETSFLPGRAFTGPADFNIQLAAVVQPGQRPPPQSVGLRPDRANRRRQGGDAAVAAGRASDRVAGRQPVGTRSLRAHRLQRLLDSSCGDRPQDRDRRRPASCQSLLRRAHGR